MSVFKVYYGGTSTYDQEFEGTWRAGACFHNYWTDSGQGQKAFEDFIKGLITNENCIVTYKADNATHIVYVDNNIIKYDKNGQKKTIHIQGKIDNPNNDIVNMAVPSLAANPEVGDTLTYLNNAISKLSGSATPQEKRAFLLGMLLLKRCR